MLVRSLPRPGPRHRPGDMMDVAEGQSGVVERHIHRVVLAVPARRAR
jgi:hypothetical protein